MNKVKKKRCIYVEKFKIRVTEHQQYTELMMSLYKYITASAVEANYTTTCICVMVVVEKLKVVVVVKTATHTHTHTHIHTHQPKLLNCIYFTTINCQRIAIYVFCIERSECIYHCLHNFIYQTIFCVPPSLTRGCVVLCLIVSL